MEEQTKKEKFLKKTERVACWGARDELWSCMDKLGVDSEKCKQYRDNYENLCPASWVIHFDRKYHYEKFKARVKSEGYEKIDVSYGKKGKTPS